MKIKYCLELFAGSSRFAMAMGRMGYYVIAIDIRFGEDHDLLSPKLRGAIMGRVQAFLRGPRCLACGGSGSVSIMC